jgi:carbonic anhydrase
MERLLDGYRRFRADIWPAERARYEALAQSGQRPETLVVACSDSRVDPTLVFGASPGELFVVRNVAGLVPPFQPDAGYHGTSAALEYGVRVLQVARIVVLGHGMCGGVRAMVEGAPREAQDFVAPWMQIAEPVLATVPDGATPDEALTHCENQIVRVSLSNLRGYPWIADAIASGHLTLHGMRFDIRTGVLSRIRGMSCEAVS